MTCQEMFTTKELSRKRRRTRGKVKTFTLLMLMMMLITCTLSVVIIVIGGIGMEAMVACNSLQEAMQAWQAEDPRRSVLGKFQELLAD